MLSKKTLFIGVVLISAILVVVLAWNMFWQKGEVSNTKMLEPVELRKYEGEKLSAIAEFRENSINGPQYIDNKSYRLKITGLVHTEMEYTYDDVVNNHQQFGKVVTLYCVEGWDVTILWEGVLVKALIDKAGVDQRAEVAIFYAHDGYTTSLPLDYLINNDILMAYKMNGVVLPPERGFPFQLVAESKLGYKWIKWITKIELSDDVNHRGYWESRGYSNDADVGTRTRSPDSSTGGIIAGLVLGSSMLWITIRRIKKGSNEDFSTRSIQCARTQKSFWVREKGILGPQS
jgi:DMSO/TMAO reductase YedYZ molybdopterin-dependent catalytic subunit